MITANWLEWIGLATVLIVGTWIIYRIAWWFLRTFSPREAAAMLAIWTTIVAVLEVVIRVRP